MGKFSGKYIQLLQKKKWIILAATFCSITPYAGVLGSYGVFLNSIINDFSVTSLQAGWVGSLAFGFTVGMCPVSTALYNIYGAKKIGYCGAIGILLSLMITSIVSNIYLMFLFYSVCFGISSNFLYNSCMLLIGDCFMNKYLAFASCFASCGISFGVLIINPVASYLTNKFGWRNSFRILGCSSFFLAFTSVSFFPAFPEDHLLSKIQNNKINQTPGLFYKLFNLKKIGNKVEKEHSSENSYLAVQPGTSSKITVASKFNLAVREIKDTVFSRKSANFHICRNPSFWLWLAGTLCWSIAFLFPSIFLIDYQETIGVDKNISAWSLTVYGVAELFGRIISALTADSIHFSLAYIYTCCSIVAGTVAVVTPLHQTLRFVYIYAIAVGLTSGSLNSLIYAATVQFFGGKSGFYVWGYVNVMLATGMVIGPILAGGLFDIFNTYNMSFYVGGIFFYVGSLFLLFIPSCLYRYPTNDIQPDQSEDLSQIDETALDIR